MRARRFYRNPNKSSTTLEPSNISLTDTECSSNIPIPNFQNSTLFPCATCFAFFLSFILFFFSFFLFSHLSLSFFLLLVLFPPQRTHFFTHTTETLHCFPSIFLFFFLSHDFLRLQLLFPHIYSTKSNAKLTWAQNTV